VTASRDGLLTLAPWSVKVAPTGELPLLPTDATLILSLDHPDFSDDAAEAEIGWVIDLVTQIRSVRAEMNIPPATLMAVVLAGASVETRERALHWGDSIKRMARLSDIGFADHAPEGAIQLLLRGEIIALPMKGVIDGVAEQARLNKEIAKAEADIKRVDTKLGNDKFLANAPKDVVEEERDKRAMAEERRAKLSEALQRLRQAMS